MSCQIGYLGCAVQSLFWNKVLCYQRGILKDYGRSVVKTKVSLTFWYFKLFLRLLFLN